VLGGKPAKSGRVVVRKKGADKDEIVCKAKGYKLNAGDMVWLETGGGGGYGPPEERDLAAIQRDLDRGYISHEAAEQDYGITVSADGKVTKKN
jgi:N-methylhydantoinase B